jgi:peptide/nickel transport system substrate-binding protein
MNKEKQLDDFFGLKPEGENPNGIKETLAKRFSRKTKIRLIPKVLSRKERYGIVFFFAVMVGSLASIPFTAYYKYTQAVADEGGQLTEGIVGEPRHINPVIAQISDADRDLAKIIYSGLLKHNEEGKLVPDLAKSYDISSDGLNYTVYLRDDVTWHDGQKFTADDVVFTIQTIQNPDYGSPLRVNWQGVEIEKIDDYALMFKLKNKYAQFLNNLTLLIIPGHLWENIRPINFSLSDINLKPVGTGPYKFVSLHKDESGKIISYELEANRDYYAKQPFINQIVFNFYPTENDMIQAYNRNDIDNMSFISAGSLKNVKFKQRLEVHTVSMPRYFGAFFNQNQSELLADKNIRLALNHATDKREILSQIFDDNGTIVNSPMLPGILDISEDIKKYDYNPDEASKILQNTGWTKNEEGMLTKNNQKFTLKLTTSSWPELASVAELLKDQWGRIGIEVNVELLPALELQSAIRERNYQILLFGEILNIDPDPFSLWHSSQKREPGLNLALYDNKTVDTLLEEARGTLNPLERIQKYNEFQRLLIEDMPAIFLYSPHYMYGQSNEVKGFSNKIISVASDRLLGIENWYINTKRIKK